MRIESGKIEEDITIADDFVMHGMFTGQVQVESGGNLILNGMATGVVVVEAGGKATINGMVTGELINNGGALHIYGTVVGPFVDAAGTTTIDRHASVQRSKRERRS